MQRDFSIVDPFLLSPPPLFSSRVEPIGRNLIPPELLIALTYLQWAIPRVDLSSILLLLLFSFILFLL